jgi:hypothetical protein
MRIEDLRHGIVLARLQFMPSNPDNSLPNDFVFEYAINDGEVVSVKASELASFGKEVVKFLKVYPLLLDQNYAAFDIYPDGKHCDVAIRILSKSDPDCEVRLSHLYYA